MPEIKFHCPRTPIVLVATKTDLRNDAKVKEELKRWNSEPIKRDDGEQLCKRIGASGFLECSAKEKLGLSEIFDTVARVTTNAEKFKQSKSKSVCQLL